MAPVRRKQEFTVPCAQAATTKHMIEALGLPHTEVELILVNGDRVSVYPRFEAMDVTLLLRVRDTPLRESSSGWIWRAARGCLPCVCIAMRRCARSTRPACWIACRRRCKAHYERFNLRWVRARVLGWLALAQHAASAGRVGVK